MRNRHELDYRPVAITQLLWGALLVLLVLLAYLPSLKGTFLWDDNANVTDSLPLRTFDG